MRAAGQINECDEPNRPPAGRFVRHITIETGHERDSPRSEVGDGMIALLTLWIDRALAGERVPIERVDPPCLLTMTAHGKCATATIVLAESGDPLVDLAIGAHSRCGAALWRSLHADAAGNAATSADRVPPEPWLAVRLHQSGLVFAPMTAEWLGDFERCLAWAWIERLR